MVFMCPVSDIFSYPDARSQNFTVLSADPDAKYVLHGEIARQRTHP